MNYHRFFEVSLMFLILYGCGNRKESAATSTPSEIPKITTLDGEEIALQDIDNQAVLNALEGGKLQNYVCDFPTPELIAHPNVIALPHLGASTREAEENCAVMVSENLRDYLENGNIRHSVNFPESVMPRNGGWRITVANANVPNMVGQISTFLAEAGLNIEDLLNKSRGDLAYTIVDLDAEVPESVIEKIRGIEGVLKVRSLGKPA